MPVHMSKYSRPSPNRLLNMPPSIRPDWFGTLGAVIASVSTRSQNVYMISTCIEETWWWQIGKDFDRPTSVFFFICRWCGVHLKSVQSYHGARSSLSDTQTTGVARAAGVEYVDAEEAKQLVDEEGYSIIDIRDAGQYNRSHIPKSLHAPLFIDNEDSDPGTARF